MDAKKWARDAVAGAVVAPAWTLRPRRREGNQAEGCNSRRRSGRRPRSQAMRWHRQEGEAAERSRCASLHTRQTKEEGAAQRDRRQVERHHSEPMNQPRKAPLRYPLYWKAPRCFPLYWKAPLRYPLYWKAPLRYPLYWKAPLRYPLYWKAPRCFPLYWKAPRCFLLHWQMPTRPDHSAGRHGRRDSFPSHSAGIASGTSPPYQWTAGQAKKITDMAQKNAHETSA